MQLLPVSRVTVPVSPILLLNGHLHLLQADRDTSRCVDVWELQYCAGTALFVIYQVDCPGLWSVCFPVWIRSGQGKECLENCRSRFEVSVHRMVHTRNSVALECRICGRLGARRSPTDCPGQPKKKGAKARQ